MTFEEVKRYRLRADMERERSATLRLEAGAQASRDLAAAYDRVADAYERLLVCGTLNQRRG
ncbi:MAG TPA: hypothetical protein VGB70_14175 [Allosphingosinicella sp.]|jgi:hypothetical protein